jgi:integrase
MATGMATILTSDTPSTGRAEVRALTDLAIRSLKDGESRTDGALPVGNGRLIIACTKARGQLRRVWSFRYRKADLRGEIKIGEHPALSLEQARNEARALLELVRQGTDPKVARFEARQAEIEETRQRAALGTFSALLDAYVEHLTRGGKGAAREVKALFKRHVTDPFPALAVLPANRITAEMVRDILARLVRKGIGRQTNVLRSYLQAAFNHGAHSDLDPRRAAVDAAVFRLASNPVTLLPRIREYEATRDRVLSDEEFRHLWRGLDNLRVEIRLTIECATFLGGQRFKQLLRATWKDYDAAAATLRLSDAKGKRATAVPHVLPVTRRVATLLKELRALNGGGEFIFSTTSGKKAIHHTSLPAHFASIAAGASVSAQSVDEPFQGRDIRRSIETRLQALGVSREVRAQLLSHGRTSGVQQKHYERHDYIREKGEALNVLEAHLVAVIAGRKRQPARSARKSSEHGQVASLQSPVERS